MQTVPSLISGSIDLSKLNNVFGKSGINSVRMEPKSSKRKNPGLKTKLIEGEGNKVNSAFSSLTRPYIPSL